MCGMMGSGKSTLGRMAARRLGLGFLDLDQEADRRLGHSFHDLVRDQGWLPFRELEYRICKEVAARDRVLFSLGGGTVRYQWNLDLLKGTGPIILLSAPLEVLAERVRSLQRPRVTAQQGLDQEIAAIWKNSGQKYLDAADVVIETHPHSLEQVADQLCQTLAELLNLDQV